VRWLLRDGYARATATLSAGVTLIWQALIMIVLVSGYAENVSALFIGAVLAEYGMGSLLGSSTRSLLVARAGISLIQIQMLAWAGAEGGTIRRSERFRSAVRVSL
jgi:hypothetical protein